MKEPRKGALGRATGIAEGVAAAVRRRQRDREPRVLLYDDAGHPRLLGAEESGRERIIELAEQLVALAVPRRAEPELEEAEPEPGDEEDLAR